MKQNKYISITGPGKVEVKASAIPEPGPGEVLLKLIYGGICGSDLGTFRGSFLYVSYPRIPGHEFSAEVCGIGEGVEGIPMGTVVTGNPYFNCGECYSCVRGYVNCCMSNKTMGSQKDGAFMQYITMPAERVYDGGGLDPKILALVEPYCIGYHAVKRAMPVKGEKVLIVGAGTIGIMALLAAKKNGAEVYVSDVSSKKLEMALENGADGVILNENSEAFIKRTDEITGNGGFDVCIEAVGLPGTFMDCINAAAYRGRVVIVGIGKKSLDFMYTVIQKKELNIMGSRNALKEDFIETIEMLRNGKISFENIMTDVYDFDDARKAFEELDAHAADKLKVMIKF